MRILFSLLLVLFLFASSANAKSAKWEELKTQGENLQTSDPIYALLKLQQAWDLLSKKNPEMAVKELRNDLAKTYGKLNPQAEINCQRLTDEQFQTHMKTSKKEVSNWQTWKITRKEDGIHLTTSESSLDQRNGCVSGLLASEEAAAKDPNKRKELDEYNAREAAKLKERISLLPVVIHASDEKYLDLLALSGPLKKGKAKTVTFDLNPFVPKQFRSINWP